MAMIIRYMIISRYYYLYIQVLCHHLISMPGDLHGRPVPKKPKAIARDAQKLGIRLLQENVLKHHEVLSLDLLSNGLNALVDMGAMFKDKRWETMAGNQNVLYINIVRPS